MSLEWKIKRDPYYSDLFAQKGLAHVEENGFFFDTQKEDINIKDTLNVLCTPLSFLYNHSSHKNPCVLLSTGSFCPIHDGHIEIMTNAKKALEENGWSVLGGYISPGHDEYISHKCKETSIPVQYRIEQINSFIKDLPWLSVDPWEGVFNKVAVNFTDVVYRMEQYIEKHIGYKIPVFFICGGDNARFASAFELKGHCVVVNRPGFEHLSENYSFLKNNRILFISGSNTASSTKIRKEILFSEPEKKILQLRINNNPLEQELKQILSPYYYSIKENLVEIQRKEFLKNNPENRISLDHFIKTTHNLEISREYDLFGIHKIGYTNRPGSKEIEIQCRTIPAGRFYLFDDDIHTGNTMRFAKNVLEKSGQEIAGILSLTISTPENTEILDAYDFFIGNENNGLVIRLPNGSTARAPYVYPYVDPTVRCSVSDPMLFSIAIWKMNMNYFKNKKLPVSSCFNHQNLFEYIGFQGNDDVYEVCKWHYTLLKSFKSDS
jgi:nicotinic acid mononucleotide adenylyltransferase